MSKSVRRKEQSVGVGADPARISGKKSSGSGKSAAPRDSAADRDGADVRAPFEDTDGDVFTAGRTIGERCRQIMTNPAARAGALSSAATVVAGLAGLLGSPADANIGFEISRTVHQITQEPCVQQVDRTEVRGERLLENCQAVLHALDSNPRLATLPEYGEFRAEVQDLYDSANRSYGAREANSEQYLEDLGRFVDTVNRWANSPDVQAAAKESGGLMDVLGQVNVLLVILTSLVGLITGRQVNRAADQS